MVNNFAQLISQLSQAKNPIVLLNQIMGNTPQFHQVMEIAKGKSSEELKRYVLNICSTQGVDLNSLAKQFNLPL